MATAAYQSTAEPLLTSSGPRLKMAGTLLLAVAAGAGWAAWPSLPHPTAGYAVLGRYMLAVGLYAAVAKACLYVEWRQLRSALFAIVNISAIALFYRFSEGRIRLAALFAIYLAMVGFHYLMLRLFAEREGRWPWLAFWSPIAALALVRYAPFVFDPIRRAVPGSITDNPATFLIGISYTAFRLSHLALEVRNRAVARPGLFEYLGYAFFLPTLVVGPINPYHTHQASLARPDRAVTPLGTSALRIIVGVTKYQFLGNIINQLSYSGLLLDGHPHAPIDLLVAGIAYHLYLYFNFSGFCDIAIGVAGLLGIQVKENFQNPLTSRSVQEYWTRWHITLSTYMRDVVFSPVSKFFIARFGARYANHAIAGGIIAVFVLIGIWHGTGWNYAIHGGLQAVGVVTNHYYNLWLKKKLGKAGYQAYHENRWIKTAAIVVTFLYISGTLFFFANDMDTIRKILASIVW